MRKKVTGVKKYNKKKMLLIRIFGLARQKMQCVVDKFSKIYTCIKNIRQITAGGYFFQEFILFKFRRCTCRAFGRL